MKKIISSFIRLLSPRRRREPMVSLAAMRAGIKKDLKKMSKSELINVVAKLYHDNQFFKTQYEADMVKYKKEIESLKKEIKKFSREAA